MTDNFSQNNNLHLAERLLLALQAGVDYLNVLNLASAEQMCRRLLMIERAVKRNPRAPDFEGLEAFLANGYDSRGGVITREFDKYIAELQKTVAQIMKQNRMLREEQDSDNRRRQPKHPKGQKAGSEAT